MEQSRITGSRRELVERLRARGISDRWVLAAMAAVPREAFGLPTDDEEIYGVAAMVEALDIQTGDQVLEIGTGSGYSAAVLSMLAGQVFTVDRVASVTATARARLDSLGYRRIALRCADGTLGWPEHAPYARILVRVTSRAVPSRLQEQLAVRGWLVLPQVEGGVEHLVRITRSAEQSFRVETLGEISCSPLFEDAGWQDHRQLTQDTD